MRDIANPVMVRVCFKCKHYTHIYPESVSNVSFIKLFDFWHYKHTLQVVNINELDPSYICINEYKREKIHEVLTK